LWVCHRHHRTVHRLGKIDLKPGVPAHLGTVPEIVTYRLPDANHSHAGGISVCGIALNRGPRNINASSRIEQRKSLPPKR